MVKEKESKKLIHSLLGLLSAVLLLIAACFSTYAWFTINEKATASGLSMKLISGSSFSFKEDIYAIRHNLDGSIISNSYKQSDGTLTLNTSTKKETEESEEEDNYDSESKNFLFTDMLPGEYVDISITYLNSDNTQIDYAISLSNFTKTSSFELAYNDQTYSHYVLGVFKVRPVTLTINYADASTDSEEITFSEEDYPYEWVGNYKIDENDTLPESKDILVDTSYNTWKTSYESCTFTFRVYEDFSQYFQLVKESGVYVSNLLSQCKFNIGSFIVDSVEE